jgi:DnaJ-class molecular chaperone
MAKSTLKQKAAKAKPAAKRDPDECPSCDGFGYLNEEGRGSVDRRNRACGDCRGTGKVS